MEWPNGMAKWRGRKIDGVAKKVKEWGVAIGSGHRKWPSEVAMRGGDFKDVFQCIEYSQPI